MRMLSVGTSGRTATVALIADGGTILELAGDPTHKHAETLLPLIERLFSQIGAGPGDMDLFCVNVGPGSFTGVRIGVSCVNAMAYALHKKIVPVDALRALCQCRIDQPGRTLAALDAANGNAYGALYENGRTLVEPSAVEAAAFLRQYGAGAVIVGDIGCQPPVYPSAGLVGEAAWGMQQLAADAVMPMYLRPSQAERLYKARAEGKPIG